MIARIVLHAAALWGAAVVLVDVLRTSEAGVIQLVGLGACVAIFWRDRAPTGVDSRWMAISSTCLLACAASFIALPRLVAVFFALASFGALLAAHVRNPGKAAGLFALACSAAPITDVVQALVGAPLRAAVSSTAAFFLRFAGLDVAASGVALVDGARIVFVDPACSGLRYLWCAILLAAGLAAWSRLDVARTIALLAVAIPATFAANVLRTTSLFLAERASVSALRADSAHIGIGAAGFALVCVVLVALTQRARRSMSA